MEKVKRGVWVGETWVVKIEHEGLDQGTKRQEDGPRRTSTLSGDKQEHVQDGDEGVSDQSRGQSWTKSR